LILLVRNNTAPGETVLSGQPRAVKELDDDYLGLVLGELLGKREVRTGTRNDVRVDWLAGTRA